MRNYQEFPKWKYQEGEAPRLVQTHTEEADLGENWYDKPDGTNHSTDLAAAAMSAKPPGYEPKEYPKWLYAREYPGGRLVNSTDEEGALPEVEWFDKPDYTYHGEDSTNPVPGAMISAMPPNALSVLQPVPEMQQGTARQKASTETDEDRKALNDKTGEAQQEAQNHAGTIVGKPHNNFDQATGTNAGDKVPSGENSGDAVGRITTTGDQTKNTAHGTKGGAAKAGTAKRKDADDLI